MPEKIRPERVHPHVGLNHKQLNSGSITDARRQAAEAKGYSEAVNARFNEYIQKQNEELAWRRKTDDWVKMAIGYTWGFLKHKGLMKQSDIDRLIFMINSKIYTPEEIVAMNKANARADELRQ